MLNSIFSPKKELIYESTFILFIIYNLNIFIYNFSNYKIFGINTFLYLSLLLAILSFVFLIKDKRILSKDLFIFFIFNSLIILTFLSQVTFLHNILGSHDKLLSFTIGGLVWFFLGFCSSNIFIRKNIFFSFLIVFFIGYLISINLNGGLVLSYYDIFNGYSASEQLSHLSTGNSSIILLVLAMALIVNSKYQMVLFFLSCLLLFSLGGRSNLIIYMVSVYIYWVLIYKKNYILISSIFLVFLGSIFLTYGIYLDNSLAQRMVSVFNINQIKQDDSYVARANIFYESLDGLKLTNIFGDTEFIVRKFGDFGYYQHNILSFWQFYGLVFLLFLIVLMVLILVKIKFYLKHKENHADVVFNFGLLLFIFCIISILTSKSANFYPLWFSLGFWLSINKLSYIK